MHKPMKKISSLILLSFLAITAFSQQDRQAENILKEMQSRLQILPGMSAELVITVENKQESSSYNISGSIKQKVDKYSIIAGETQVYSDGKTKWLYMSDVNEVTISTINEEDHDPMNNPFVLLNNFKEKFKYKFITETINEGILYQQIDLHPIDINQNYHTISLRIQKSNLMIKSIQYMGKNGTHYLIELNQPTIRSFEDYEFIFKADKYPDIEIIDLRD